LILEKYITTQIFKECSGRILKMNFKIKYSHYVNFDVLTAVIIESYIVWDYIPEGRTPCCNSVGEFISKFPLPKLSGTY
jgi:hypothetical protein